MVDNVAVTAGTGTSIATDEVSGNHYQRIKISNGEADSVVHLGVYAEDEAHTDGDTGLMTLAVRKDTPAALSGTDGDYEPLQTSGGKLWVRNLSIITTLQLDVTRPADTTLYTAADALSDSTSAPTTGGFTFTGAARVSGGSGRIIGASFCTSNDPGTRMSGELWLFNQAVTNINDNSPFAVSDAEIKTCVGVIPFTFFDAGNNGFMFIPNLSIPFTCVGSANLRALFRVRNGYTPASSEVITSTLVIEHLD